VSSETITVTELVAYEDDRGNVIEYDGVPIEAAVTVIFAGSNNRLTVATSARVGELSVRFDCDAGVMTIGKGRGRAMVRASARVGQDAAIHLGDGVTMTTRCTLSAVEGATLRVGDDVMIAGDCQLRCDDGHPIFDVASERRLNPARDIVIGDHVWLGNRSMVLGGAVIEDGSVIGMASLVKGRIPNNCIAVGAPARVVRRDIAWERPHLSLDRPYYKPDASTIRKSRYWAPTRREPGRLRRTYHRLPRGLRTTVRRLLGRPVDGG